MVGTKEFFDAFNCNSFNVVDNGITAVVALAWVTLAVLIGEYRASCPHDCRRGEVFTGNELQASNLALALILNK